MVLASFTLSFFFGRRFPLGPLSLWLFPFTGQILAKGDDLPLDSSSCVVEPVQTPLARQSLERMVAKVTK